ncbi:hypothetical protein EHQ23_18310 [Leptospira bourretii]|uniref:DUF2191 domain-containing protein n=2 Tax=Leptospira bourretii TaxID=2484962 RepID=A0A4R9ILB6_9LEPT|nr:hypothetical protein EHQ23_18310 [Leptospira bourretii]TGK89761.1 hypothetical protein EHQ26_15160 [Leptospira bourretii]TGL19476.1 hypothetical protein EHQ47_15300 [Leptospira bourretii]TGL35952.1 hypothetical protein EHQ45_08140 [Leptospira bourretii]
MTDPKFHRILYRMKVTAILPDELIIEVQKYTEGKNITDSLQKALSEWVKLAKVKKLNEKLRNKPLEFSSQFSAEKIRKINRTK